MAARVVKLRTKAERLRVADGEHLRQMVLSFAENRRVPDRAIGEIVSAIDRETSAASGWTFVMISAEANNAVVEWLFDNADRPQVAVRLWMKLFLHLRRDTGEVMRSRDELAADVGIRPQEVSRVMSLLESIHAISRERDGKVVRYVMSPLAGTHLTGALRAKAQKAAPPLKLSLPPAE